MFILFRMGRGILHARSSAAAAAVATGRPSDTPPLCTADRMRSWYPDAALFTAVMLVLRFRYSACRPIVQTGASEVATDAAADTTIPNDAAAASCPHALLVRRVEILVSDCNSGVACNVTGISPGRTLPGYERKTENKIKINYEKKPASLRDSIRPPSIYNRTTTHNTPGRARQSVPRTNLLMPREFKIVPRYVFNT